MNDRRGGDFLLAPTAEEAFTSVVASECSSYRDFENLGLGLYQTGRKYRDEGGSLLCISHLGDAS